MNTRAVQWIGHSEQWVAEEHQGFPGFIMPLAERFVFDVATMKSPARKLPLAAAVNCTSRLALRVALAVTGLNPRWRPVELFEDSVIKTAASAANLGVRFLPPNEYIGHLAAIAPDLGSLGVIEEKVDGAQYEVDGFVIGGEVRPFHPLLQHWNEAGDRILGYERQRPPSSDWLAAVSAAVKAVGIRDAPFCIEMRWVVQLGKWRVIEIHPRLGEDPGLAAFMCDDNPLEVIERACQQEMSRWRRRDHETH